MRTLWILWLGLILAFGSAGPAMAARSHLEQATFGGGCFWCVEAVFEQVRGVSSVVSGYAGGHVPAPSYEQVCSGKTGHAEVVRVTFDPAVLSYGDLLRLFFTAHDPTTRDRQDHDEGAQYRSIILTASAEQARVARQVIRELDAAHLFRRPIVTEVKPLVAFYRAEEYHQDYFARNPDKPYCALVVAPKVEKFRKRYLDRLKR